MIENANNARKDLSKMIQGKTVFHVNKPQESIIVRLVQKID